MPTEKIKYSDNLKQGTDKLNQAIEEVNSFQQQIDEIVIEGDSSVEAAQARVSVEGTAYPTLKARLDAENQQLTAQLDETEVKKADKDYVDRITGAIASGSPKPFATLAALNDAYPSGDTNSYVVMTDGNLYYWNGSAWTIFGPYLSGPIGRQSVTDDKTTFLKRSTNLFNKKDVMANTNINMSDGTLVSNVNYHTTGFIPVSGSQDIITDGVFRKGFYDANFNFISQITADGASTTPANAQWVRLSIPNANLNTAQLNLGNVLLPYENYYLAFDDLRVRSGIVSVASPADTTFVEPASNNLYNRFNILINKVVNATTGLIVDNGFHSVDKDYKVIDPTKQYVGYKIGYVSWYDEAKAHISRTTLVDNVSVTPPTNARFALLSVISGYFDVAQFNVGSSIAHFEEYETAISGKRIKTVDTLRTAERYMIEGSLRGIYDSPTIAVYPNLVNISTTQVYALYDALVTNYPDLWSSEVYGQDGVGNDIKLYRFKTPSVGRATYNFKRPKVLFISGIHAEKAGIYCLYQCMRAITEDWETNELLETLRFNVEYLVMPVVNAYGVNTYNRTNENGVNLSRNFPASWTLSAEGPNYSGPSPLSELGAQHVDRLLRENRDAIMFTSFHNFSSNEPGMVDREFTHNLSVTTLQTKIMRNLISKLSRKWKSEYAWLPQDETTYFGYADKGLPPGSEGQHATDNYNMIGSSLEISQVFLLEPGATDFDSVALTLGVDVFMNFIIANVRELTEYYNTI